MTLVVDHIKACNVKTTPLERGVDIASSLATQTAAAEPAGSL